MKSAKEKAKELVVKFKPFAHESYHDLNTTKQMALEKHSNAIECALIAVDEIIKTIVWHNDFNDEKRKYWQEVKKEINKL